jgi:hypothetical protein
MIVAAALIAISWTLVDETYYQERIQDHPTFDVYNFTREYGGRLYDSEGYCRGWMFWIDDNGFIAIGQASLPIEDPFDNDPHTGYSRIKVFKGPSDLWRGAIYHDYFLAYKWFDYVFVPNADGRTADVAVWWDDDPATMLTGTFNSRW